MPSQFTNLQLKTSPLVFEKKKCKSIIKTLKYIDSDTGKTRHYPAGAQEWYNSVYTYNKNYLKTLPALDKTLSILLKNYCNMWPKQKKFKQNPLKLRNFIRNNFKTLGGKRRYRLKRTNNVRVIKLMYSKKLKDRQKKTQYKGVSPKRVFIGKGNLKHTSSKVVITLHTYNAAKYKLLRKIRELVYNTFLTKKLLSKVTTLFEDKYKNKDRDNTIVKIMKNKKDRKGKNYPSKYIKVVGNNGVRIKNISLFNRRLTLDEYLSSSYQYTPVSISNPYEIISKGYQDHPDYIPANFIHKVEKLGKKNSNYTVKNISSFYNIISFVISHINIVTRRLKIILKYYKYLTVLVEKKILNNNEKFLMFISKANKFNTYKYRNTPKFIMTRFKEKRIYLASLLRFAWLLYISEAKFKNPLLVSKLKYMVKNLYDKEVEFNLVELKKFHLSSDIYTQLVALKLQNRKNKLFRVLKRSLTKVDLPNVSRATERYSEFNKDEYLANKIRNRYIDFMFKNKSSKIDSLNNLLLNLFPPVNRLNMELRKIGTKLIYPVNLQEYVIKSVKHHKLAGIRIEARGRLTKRLTAQRSIFKMYHKGGLKNVDSSFKGLPAVLLRGFRKTNVEYSIVQSKTPNGAYGIKGWVGSK